MNQDLEIIYTCQRPQVSAQKNWKSQEVAQFKSWCLLFLKIAIHLRNHKSMSDKSDKWISLFSTGFSRNMHTAELSVLATITFQFTTEMYLMAAYKI
jgi:hypothetical protein